MVDRARELGAPFMAGSSLVFAWREPWLEHPLGASIDTAVAIGYSGLDIYGFHALEALQCMVERRAGGEVGLAAVQCLEGDDVWEAAGAFCNSIITLRSNNKSDARIAQQQGLCHA
eukprot:COSAG05_NODE_1028_length_6112_cov_11.983868_8_plen_116_part_00